MFKLSILEKDSPYHEEYPMNETMCLESYGLYCQLQNEDE